MTVPIVRNGRPQVVEEGTSAPVRRAGGGRSSGSANSRSGGSTKARGKAAVAAAGDQGQQVASNAARQSKEVAGAAGEQAREVAGVVREQAAQLTQELTSQGRTLYAETRQQVESQAEIQTQSLAAALHRLGGETQALADGRPADAGSLGTYAQQCADKLHEVAWNIEDRGVEGLIEDLGQFARRRPGAFLVGAALLGFGGGRLIRSAGGAGSDESDESAVPAPAPTPARTPTRRSAPGRRRASTVGTRTGGRNPAAMGGE